MGQAHRSLDTAKKVEALPATKTALCLKCHSSNDGRCDNTGPRFLLSDGVGCESCHGPAGRWLTVHYRDDFRNQSPEYKASLGMRNTKDLATRAKVCTECHVGNVNKDVNHDLIAAGHPRLNFEYAAFLANYPKHWSRSRPDRPPHPDFAPDFEARAWAVGQAASAQAALDLLAYRAEEKHGRPWPEFAEYDCFACHHSDLRQHVPNRRDLLLQIGDRRVRHVQDEIRPSHFFQGRLERFDQVVGELPDEPDGIGDGHPPTAHADQVIVFLGVLIPCATDCVR